MTQPTDKLLTTSGQSIATAIAVAGDFPEHVLKRHIQRALADRGEAIADVISEAVVDLRVWSHPLSEFLLLRAFQQLAELPIANTPDNVGQLLKSIQCERVAMARYQAATSEDG